MKFTDDLFMAKVLPHVEGCDPMVAADHIRTAARAFAEQTRVWTFTTEPVYTVVGEELLPIDIDDDMEITKILGAWLDKRELSVFQTGMGRANAREERGGTFIWREGQDIGFYPPATVEQAVVLELAVKPSLTSTEWPDELVGHVDDIAHGAVASLAVMPKQEWSDLKVAEIQAGKFKLRIDVVGYNAMRGSSAAARVPGRRLI